MLKAHKFVTCLSTGYKFSSRDMPLQKSGGVAILVFLQECSSLCTVFPTQESHRSKLGLRSTNAIRTHQNISMRAYAGAVLTKCFDTSSSATIKMANEDYHLTLMLMFISLALGRRDGLMVSTLDSGPGSRPGRGHCVVFMGKTLHFHSACLCLCLCASENQP